MKATPADPTLRDIHLLFRGGAAGGLTDGELLGRFVATGDQAAFEVLVHRLGPMVLGVCRRLLRDRHDAEDAFQATFLVLARRASAVDPPSRVGPWLYGVALRVGMRGRSSRARRRSREVVASNPPERESEPRPERDDLLPLLDGELARLPEKYREPIVLCHLEGKPYSEAARQLGLREGTFSGRLSRGRALLAARLSRRAAALSAGSLAVLLTKQASARVPTPLAASAVGVACGIRGGVPPVVAALTEGTLRTMLMTRLRSRVLGLLAGGLVLAGVTARGVAPSARGLNPPSFQGKATAQVAKDQGEKTRGGPSEGREARVLDYFAAFAPDLLAKPAIGSELGLTDEQNSEVKSVDWALNASLTRAYQDMASASDRERLERVDGLQRLSRRETRHLAEILRPEQLRRFTEIVLQRYGVEAMGYAEIQDALRMSPEQKKKVQAIEHDLLARNQAALKEFLEGQNGPDAADTLARRSETMSRKVEALRGAALDRIFALLSVEQKTSWEAMKGKVFRLDAATPNRP